MKEPHNEAAGLSAMSGNMSGSVAEISDRPTLGRRLKQTACLGVLAAKVQKKESEFAHYASAQYVKERSSEFVKQ